MVTAGDPAALHARRAGRDGSRPPLLQAALNGRRTRSEHPAVPLAPGELAADARACVEAGAGALHFHARDDEGRESIAPDDVDRAVGAVRAACPETPVGVSTGAWIVADPLRRVRLVGRWTERPDYASVNVHESGSLELAEALLDLGIGVEAGLADGPAAETFAGWAAAERCLRVLIEPPAATGEPALRAARDVEAALDEAGLRVPRLLHGVDGAAWPLLAEAAARGLPTRIGLEDTLVLPDGERAPGNEALVRAAADWMRDPAAAGAAAARLA